VSAVLSSFLPPSHAESLPRNLPSRAQKAQARLHHRYRRRLARIHDLDDFQRAAARYLPASAYGYVANGAETETALRTNRAAFQRYRFITRILEGVAARSQRTTLFGHSFDAPFGIAPMGAAAAVAYEADSVMARAAARARIPFVLSGNSLIPMEEVARAYDAGTGGRWFAAYQNPNRRDIEGMVERVAAAGFDAYVLTADVPVGSNREADARHGFSLPLRPNLKLAADGLAHPRWLASTALRTLVRRRGQPHLDNLNWDGGPGLFSSQVAGVASHVSLDWGHVRLIRSLWRGPLIVKGVLSKADALTARDCGVDGIIVSNHGGRQLDSAATPLQVLPGIVEVAGNMTVMIDSGFRRGTDVLKALALGAGFVFVGRPFLFAAAVAGEAGVLQAIALLSREIDKDLALLGLNSIGEASSDMLLDLHHPVDG